MATARSVLRGLLADELQSTRFTSLSTTSAGNAGGTTLVDTGLLNLPDGGEDDTFNGFWIIVTELVSGGPAIGESAKVSDYATATGTLTLESALTAQIKTGTSYELHRYDPLDLNTSINRAVELLYPHLYVPQRNETLWVDNLLLNSSFEVSTAGPVFTSWSSIGTPTLTAETSRKVHGSQAAGIAATGATEGLEQNIFTSVNFRRVVGKTLHVRGWVFATVANAGRLRVTFDGTTYTNGPWQGGNAEWEDDSVQTISVAIPADATEMTVSCEMEDGSTGYFDLVRAWIDPIYRYTIPSAILKGPYTLSLQRSLDEPDGPFDPITNFVIEEDSSGRYIILNQALPPGYGLKITGIGLLSTMSSDSATTEIDAPRTHLVVARAAQWLFENMPGDTAIEDRQVYEREAAKWKQRVAELVATPGMRMYEPGAQRNVRWSYGV